MGLSMCGSRDEPVFLPVLKGVCLWKPLAVSVGGRSEVSFTFVLCVGYAEAICGLPVGTPQLLNAFIQGFKIILTD